MHASNLFGRTIGSTKLKTIVKAYPNLLDGPDYQPTEAQVAGISGIGPITATQFLNSLPDFFEFMDEIGIPCRAVATKLSAATATTQPPTQPPTQPTTQPVKSLAGVIVVFTGVRDKELEALIEARGGKVSTSVSGKTSVVVAKNPAELTGKVKTANELGIPIVTIEAFKDGYL